MPKGVVHRQNVSSITGFLSLLISLVTTQSFTVEKKLFHAEFSLVDQDQKFDINNCWLDLSVNSRPQMNLNVEYQTEGVTQFWIHK